MVAQQQYIPGRGDIIGIVFTPKSGHEQSGKRPAIVLSGDRYNEKTSLLIACPITSRTKGYPFEVQLPATMKTHGVILADQVKSMDWRRRNAHFIEKAPHHILEMVLERLFLLLKE